MCPLHNRYTISFEVFFKAQVLKRVFYPVNIHMIEWQHSVVLFNNCKSRTVYGSLYILSPWASPFVKVVLPAPRSPSRAMTSPGCKQFQQAFLQNLMFAAVHLKYIYIHSYPISPLLYILYTFTTIFICYGCYRWISYESNFLMSANFSYKKTLGNCASS